MHKIKLFCEKPYVFTFTGRHLFTNTINRDSEASTVDLNEISNFAMLKSKWWDPNGPMKPLHSLNKIRVPLIRNSLIATNIVKFKHINTARPLQNLKIVDVGCGGGILSEALARMGATVVGVDASEDLLEIAKSHASQDVNIANNIEYVSSTLEDYSFEKNECFDAIIASEVIEHVANQDLFIKSCIKVLKPGGSLFVTTLNKTMLSWLLGVVVAESTLLPRGTHNWEKFISPIELSRILHDNGCTIHLIHGLAYCFVTNQWHCISNTSINYALHAVKI